MASRSSGVQEGFTGTAAVPPSGERGGVAEQRRSSATCHRRTSRVGLAGQTPRCLLNASMQLRAGRSDTGQLRRGRQHARRQALTAHAELNRIVMNASFFLEAGLRQPRQDVETPRPPPRLVSFQPAVGAPAKHRPGPAARPPPAAEYRQRACAPTRKWMAFRKNCAR